MRDRFIVLPGWKRTWYVRDSDHRLNDITGFTSYESARATADKINAKEGRDAGQRSEVRNTHSHATRGGVHGDNVSRRPRKPRDLGKG